MIVLEDAQRTPFTGKDQLGKAIAIQVAEYCPAHQPHLFQDLAVDLVQNKLAPFIAVNMGAGRFWPAPWNDPPAHKQVQLTVPIEIPQGQWSHAAGSGGHHCGEALGGPIIARDRGAFRLAVLVIGQAN